MKDDERRIVVQRISPLGWLLCKLGFHKGEVRANSSVTLLFKDCERCARRVIVSDSMGVF
jgi:hypothetical protein